jgi:hypothetical protein
VSCCFFLFRSRLVGLNGESRYTSQALVKKGNRRGEYLLREAEAWWSSSPALLERYPSAALARLWQLLLLTQFHDVLPGSSVAPVYRDAEQHLRQVADEASALLQQALALIEENERAAQSGGAGCSVCLFVCFVCFVCFFPFFFGSFLT